MAEPSVFSDNLNNPDSSGYKGPRANQDGPPAATPTVPGMAGHGGTPAGPPAGQQYPAGTDPSGGGAPHPGEQPPWGGPVYDLGAQPADSGYAQDYAMGATYAPGADGAAGPAWGSPQEPAWNTPGDTASNPPGDTAWGSPGDTAWGTHGDPPWGGLPDGAGWSPGGSVAGVAEPQIPAAYTSSADGYTSLASFGGGHPAGQPPGGNTLPGDQTTAYSAQPVYQQDTTSPQVQQVPYQQQVPSQHVPTQQGPTQQPPAGGQDDVSFRHPNLDMALSGPPGGHPNTGTDPGGADSHGIEVSVDGAVVSSGDGSVEVNVGDTTRVTADPGSQQGTGQGRPGEGQSGQDQHQGAGQGQHQGTGQDQQGGQQGPQSGQHGQVPTGDQKPDGQFIHGDGENAANVELTVDRATMGDVPVQVAKNADGSVDIQVPKAGPDGHDVRVHVGAGKNADIELARDEHGNVVVRARPDAEGDNKAGTSPPGGDPGAGGADDPSKDPNDQARDPNEPAGGGGPPGGGGGPPGGGGGPPGGGGGPPGGGGGPPGGGGYPPGSSQQQPGKGDGGGRRNADPETIRKLGTDLTDKPGTALDTANTKAGNIDVGFPGFGVLGIPLNLAHDQLRGNAQSYMSSGREQLDNWRTQLNQSANNWQNSEDASTVQEG